MNEISPIKFFKYYQKNLNFKIIDIRDSRDFEQYNRYKKYTYFIMCKNGNNSYQATRFLSRLGYNVINVIGGIDHWMGSVITKYA